jgi:hypothetical protein
MFARLSLIVSALAFYLNFAAALPHFGWYPRPTGAFPLPTGGFPLPTGWPQPTGGFNPFPTGFPTGFPPGWVPGEGPAPTGVVAKPLEKRFEGARRDGGHDGFWWGNWGGNWGNWGPKPTATAIPIPTGNAAFPTGAWGPTGTGAWGYPTAPVPVPTGY